ncbi:DUF2752 domain-containing protein [Gordonia sp. CPCC 205515]|uniref:DUF2752 domain-containing protein n=1 Tax=Gordonia sp. CPCC 205515 TaxID=3140791 RepID=UPI003AF35290
MARQEVATAASVAIGGVAVLAAAAVLSPSAMSGGPDLCPFRRMTGLPCPACGLTRSWVSFAHGDVSAAFGYNLFGPVFMAVALVATVVAVWVLVTGRPALDRLGARLTGRIAAGVLLVWFGYGLVRLLFAANDWGLFPSVT